MSFLARVSPVRMLQRVFARVINVECVPIFDSYEHISNMKTSDLFQFEPFNDNDLENFPRENAGRNYDLNWSLAGEWFTVWGNAYRNPEQELLMKQLKCVMDDKKNAFCRRSYKNGSDVSSNAGDFSDLTDEVKEFLSGVPNLYVEDAAIASGRLLETRIRSVTNDPATALAIKSQLHRMPLRHPQTPHPLGLIIARGMPTSFTAIGEDPHSRSLTVLAGGDVSIERIFEEVVKATDMYYDRERGLVDMAVNADHTASPVSIKGPLSKCIMPCSTLLNASGDVILAFGLPRSMITPLVMKNQLFCDNNTVLCRDGVSRLFAGVACDSNKMKQMEGKMVLNQVVYEPVEGDNLLTMPKEVLFVSEENGPVISDSKDILEMLQKKIGNDECASFVAEKLKTSTFRTVSASSVESFLN